jgi:hypothetical protein
VVEEELAHQNARTSFGRGGTQAHSACSSQRTGEHYFRTVTSLGSLRSSTRRLAQVLIK